MTDVDLSVLLCTYNRAEILDEALERLVGLETEGRFGYEVVVVDNGSTDKTNEVVEQRASKSGVQIRYVFERAEGVAQARNRAVREATGRWLAFLDDDELADARWLAGLSRASEQTPARILGGPVYLHLEPHEIERLGREQRRLLRERGADRFGDSVAPFPPGVNPGTDNLFVARDVFDEIGGFDQSMMAGGSDSDFMIRARAAGIEPWFVPDAVVFHRVPEARLTASGIKHDALQSGAMLAFLAARHRGKRVMLAELIARFGQALLVTLPMMLKAKILRDGKEIVDRQIKWWRMVGFARRATSLVAPAFYDGGDFLRSIDFRGARPEAEPGEDAR
jgi:GT2 family glycosyltransferase